MKKWLLLTAAVMLTACEPQTGGSLAAAPPHRAPPQLIPDEPFRADRPESSFVAPSMSLAWQAAQLDNGLRIVLLERHDLPIVSIRLSMNRGRFDVDAPPEAFSMLTHAMAHGGADSRGPEALDTAYRSLGSWYWVSFSRDWCSLDAKLASRDLEPVLDLLSATALHPNLASPTFERLRDDWAAGMSKPPTSAPPPMMHDILTLLGADSAHGFTSLSKKRMQELTTSEVTALYEKIFQPEQATLVVVGDATMDSVKAAASRSLGGWRRRSGPFGRPAIVGPLISPSHALLVQRNEQHVDTILLARGPAPSSEDAPALRVLAHCLGDPWSSLHEALREENGANYSMGAELMVMRDGSTIRIGVPLEAPKAMRMLEVTLAAIDAIRTSGPRMDDFERARALILAQWRSGVSTNDGLATGAAQAIAMGTGLDSIAEYPARIMAVTPDDVRRAANRYLARESLRLVVGGPAAMLPPMRNLGLGPVETMSSP